MIGRASPLALVLALLTLAPSPARAQSQADFVGTWYSETPGEGTFQGKAYDMRRELLHNRPDSTKTNTNRYYQGATLVGESTATYAWGVANGVYWTECRTVISGSQSSVCSTRNEYDIVSVSAREIRYTSRRSGTTYSMIRVSDDFQLP